MAGPSMRSDDALAWIARSVLIICGGAFLIVGCQLFWRWYGYFQPLGTLTQLAAWGEAEQIDEGYWQAIVTAHWQMDSSVMGYELVQLQQKVLASGYFERFHCEFHSDRLDIHYKVRKPLAVLRGVVPEEARASDSFVSLSSSVSALPKANNLVNKAEKASQAAICLYEGGKLLPYLSGSLLLPSMQLKLSDEKSEVTQADQAALASNIASQIQANEELQEGIREQKWASVCLIDLEAWRGSDHPASEVILIFNPLPTQSKPRGLLMRLGSSRLARVEWLAGPQLLCLLQLAQQKNADWIDARLGDMVVLGRENEGATPLE